MGHNKKAKKMHNRNVGKRGEAAAVRYLELRGYDVIDRNWTCPAGEVDIVARDGDWLVFVEVKTRTSLEKGFPSEAVDEEKRSRYEMIAAWYLKDNAYYDIPVRFDIVALLVAADDRALVKHYVDAFRGGCL